MTFGTRWVVVVQTSLVHWVDVWRIEQFGSRCTIVIGSLDGRLEHVG